MGGIGSGLTSYHPKTAVHDCYVLDVNQLARKGFCHLGARGEVWWTDQLGVSSFVVNCSIVFDIHLNGRCLQLSYRWINWFETEAQDVSISVPLQTTQPYFGGERPWFTCPLSTDGIPCNRRVGKLYLTPFSPYFGCRYCHDLVYRSPSEMWQRLERARCIARSIHEQVERITSKQRGSSKAANSKK